MLLQLVLWAFDPRPITPNAATLVATHQFYESVQTLEARGEVLVVGRGHVTRERHFQISALADAARVQGHTPKDLQDALAARRFAAIIDDARLPGRYRAAHWPAIMLEDFDDLRAPLLANYFVARRIPDDQVSAPMEAPAFARWVLLPRVAPLPTNDIDALKRRQLAEVALANERADAVRRGEEPAFSEAQIEVRAGATP